MEVVDRAPASARDQIGGIPANIGPDTWPVCNACKAPLTFIAQVACGPDEVLRYPERGSIAIFLCNSEPPTEALCITADGTGTAVFFVEEAPAAPMFDEAQRQAIASMHVASMLRSIDQTAP
ncbi:MAG: hypothetical protein ACKV2T_36925 [Kofleriaceae bacterium]